MRSHLFAPDVVIEASVVIISLRGVGAVVGRRGKYQVRFQHKANHNGHCLQQCHTRLSLHNQVPRRRLQVFQVIPRQMYLQYSRGRIQVPRVALTQASQAFAHVVDFAQDTIDAVDCIAGL